MFIVTRSALQKNLLILLLILLLLRITPYFWKIHNLGENQSVSMIYLHQGSARSCWYHSELFSWQIPNCQSYQIGTAWRLVGVIDQVSDKRQNGQKILMLTTIEPCLVIYPLDKCRWWRSLGRFIAVRQMLSDRLIGYLSGDSRK